MTSSDIDALFVQGPALSIRNSFFVNNSAEGGGAVSAASLFSINVAGSNFTGNQGFGGGGGAVAILTTQKQPPMVVWGPFLMDNLRFHSNSIGGSVGGGAVYVSGLSVQQRPHALRIGPC